MIGFSGKSLPRDSRSRTLEFDPASSGDMFGKARTFEIVGVFGPVDPKHPAEKAGAAPLSSDHSRTVGHFLDV